MTFQEDHLVYSLVSSHTPKLEYPGLRNTDTAESLV